VFAPFPITTIQTDNGLEFLGDFEEYLRQINIPHVFIYPRCCKVNGVVERYQRSLQEEFLDNNLDLIYDPVLLNDKLIDYMLFYNTKRVHKSLGLITPMDFLITKGGMSKMSMTHTSY
jgi:putative transposase